MKSVFKKPQCLIFTELSTGKLQLDHEVLDQIASVTKSINSVAIAGIYRTGKSYLLTRLAGQYKGFPLGSSIESETKGIWAWCVVHPKREDEMLLLLDTEGLGDIKKGDLNHDNQLFTLATLLSSTLIYNSLGTFNDDALNKLNFITEMSKNIKTSDENQSTSSDADFDIYFPEFILTLRDFSLDLRIDGHDISSDQYLEDCLKLKVGDSPEIHSYNKPRNCIRKYFKCRKCFVFGCPAKRSQLKDLENMTDSKLNEDFVEDTKAFLSYVLDSCQSMKLINGMQVSGRMFSSLAINYVEAIRQGGVPCILNALQSMALIENEAAVTEAFGNYVQEMENEVVIPTVDAQSLTDIHLNSKDLAFRHFLKRRMLDEEDTYKVKLDNVVNEEYGKWVTKNENKSEELCKKVLEKLHANILENINAGVYAIPGGYEIYSRDRERLYLEYTETLGLGVMKDVGFLTYSNYVKNEADAVLQSDQSLSEKEKALNLERESKERAINGEEMTRLKLEQTKKEIEDIAKQHDTEIKKMREIDSRERVKERETMEKIAEQRLRERNRLQKENMLELVKQMDTVKNDQIERDRQHQIQLASLNQQRLNEKDSMIKAMKEMARNRPEPFSCTIS